MKFNPYAVVAILLCPFLPVLPAAIAQDGPSFPFLLEHPDVRTQSLGGVILPSEESTMQLYTDFSARPTLTDQRLNTAYAVSIFPENASGRSLLHTFSTSLLLGGRHAIGAGFRYWDATNVQARNQAGDLYTLKPYDWSIDLAYAFALTPNWAFHVGGSYFQSYIGKTAEGAFFSAGVRYHDEVELRDQELNYSVALHCKNLGPDVRYGSEGEKVHLPGVIQLEGSLGTVFNENHSVGLGLQGGLFVNAPGAKGNFGVGLEYGYNHLLSLRTGYEWGLKGNRYSVGGGVYWYGIGLDLAYTMGDDSDFNTFSIGLSHRF